MSGEGPLDTPGEAPIESPGEGLSGGLAKVYGKDPDVAKGMLMQPLSMHSMLSSYMNCGRNG